MDVISGVAPIRSVVNVGSGVADLVLLPIAQYKKDGRVLRGVQKGATSFFKSTAMEAIKLGARLATGTQVILEQAENVLGTKDPITAEALQLSPGLNVGELGMDDEDVKELISKYAEQPQGVREGLHSGYKSLKRNVNSAAQTILAVPMEVYESSNEVSRCSCHHRCLRDIETFFPGSRASRRACRAYRGAQAYDWCERSGQQDTTWTTQHVRSEFQARNRNEIQATVICSYRHISPPQSNTF